MFKNRGTPQHAPINLVSVGWVSAHRVIHQMMVILAILTILIQTEKHTSPSPSGRGPG